MNFLEGEIVILNEKAKNGLPNRLGERGMIGLNNLGSRNYEYILEFDDKLIAPVKETEINRLTESDKQYMEYIFTGNKVIHAPTNQEVKIVKVDYIHMAAEVDFISGGSEVIDFTTIKPLEKENEIVSKINETTNDNLVNIFFDHYKNPDNTYTVPKQLLINLLNSIFED